jgi:hypothetical protein
VVSGKKITIFSYKLPCHFTNGYADKVRSSPRADDTFIRDNKIIILLCGGDKRNQQADIKKAAGLAGEV